MNRFIAIAFALVAVAAAYYFGTQSSSPARSPAANEAGGAANPAVNPTRSTAEKVSPRMVLQMDPRVKSTTPPSSKLAAPAPQPTLTQEFLVSKEYAPLYAKPGSLPQNAETLGVRAAILASCGTRTDRPKKPVVNKEELRAKFIASLPVNHPDNDARTRAYDATASGSCTDFPETPVTKAEIDAAYKAAADAGDAVARARDIECAIFAPKPGEEKPEGFPKSPTLTDEQFAGFKEILASKNPRALEVLGGLLANTYDNGQIKIDPNAKPADPFAVRYALELLSCDYGMPCEAGFQQRSHECARKGQCNAATLAEHISFYQA
jgi:hypothetical protein